MGELGLFLKSEWSLNSPVLKDVRHRLEGFDGMKASDGKHFFILVGRMMVLGHEHDILPIVEEVLQEFLQQSYADLALDAPLSANEKQILRIASQYFRSSPINYKQLYYPGATDRQVAIGNDIVIQLPPLPQIKSKQLAGRALVHKELYMAFLQPGHYLHEEFTKHGLIGSQLSVIRRDLLFLDGLGDLVIALEACRFLYQFQAQPKTLAQPLGRKTFYALRRTLCTNLFLLRLALAYNLTTALEDPYVTTMLTEIYVPHTMGSLTTQWDSRGKYEQEFIADYFEQYVGALFLENPDLTKNWLQSLFQRFLGSITSSYTNSSSQEMFASLIIESPEASDQSN